jgi:hypothetical protein
MLVEFTGQSIVRYLRTAERIHHYKTSWENYKMGTLKEEE